MIFYLLRLFYAGAAATAAPTTARRDLWRDLSNIGLAVNDAQTLVLDYGYRASAQLVDYAFFRLQGCSKTDGE